MSILGIVKNATKAKVAVYTCGLDISQTETKGTVLLKKAEDLLNFSRGEEKQLEGVSYPLIVSLKISVPYRSIVLQRNCRLRCQAHHCWFRYR